MSVLLTGLMYAAAGVLGGWLIPAPWQERRLDQAHERAYEKGWDDCQAAEDEMPVAARAYQEVGRVIDRWNDQDEQPTVITDAQPGAGGWYDMTMRELAPEADERPASHTDQFRAITHDLSWADREGLIEWDYKVKSDRVRDEFDEWRAGFFESWRADVEQRGAA